MIPCFGCRLCLKALSCEPGDRDVMLCMARGGERVTDWDGCTLGEPGEPRRAVEALAHSSAGGCTDAG